MSEPDYDSVGSPVAANEEEGRVGADGDDSVDGDRVVDDVSAGESESESAEEGEGESVSEEREKDDSLPGEVTRDSEKSDSDGESGEGEGGERRGEKEKGGVDLESSDPDRERSVEASVSSQSRGVRSSGFLESDESEGEGETEGRGGGDQVEGGDGDDGDGGGGEDVSVVRGGRRKFLGDSDDEEEEAGPGERSPGNTEGESRGEKRGRASSASAGESEEESGAKRLREAVGSEDEEEQEGEEEGEELEQEVGDLVEGEGRGEVPDVGGERTVQEEEEEEPGSEEEAGPSTAGMSDWEIMMQRRKEAMAKARKRRRRDIDIRAVDDHIMAMIREMRQAVEEDRQLNLARQPALKKLKMLPTVIAHLKKADLQTTFIECGILTVLAEWLNPLPDHSLPHLKIREAILDILKSYPIPESHILKSSRIGKAVMLLFRHPKETRKNKEKAGKLINEWARPIFGLASDFKSLGRDEREERDYANLSQAAKRRLSSSSDPKTTSQEEEYEPSKPGDKGWIGRARVPMPSTRDYVVRPKWKVDTEFKRSPSKKVLNRYEKQINKEKQRKMQRKTSHAVSISVEGRKMPL